jgi:cytochrome c biogenesis protein CcmG/thiol:disulfide interchange protein DsbE
MSRGQVTRIVVVGAGLAAVALVITFAVAMRRGVGLSEVGVAAVPFTVAPDFTLTSLDGGSTFTLSDHATGPVFIYFWASWCQPCQQEAAVIERLWPEYQQLGYTFVGVNIWDTESDARDFVTEHHLTFPILHEVAGSVYVNYGVSGLPEAFFLRPGLQVNQKFNGALDEKDFRAMLAKIQAAS